MAEKMQVVVEAVDKATAQVQNIGKGMKKALSFIGITAGAVMLSKAINKVGQAYNKQVQAEVQLATALRSTGNILNTTTEELRKKASAMQTVTKFGDEQIIQAQALLLTFKNVGNEVYDDTMKIIADISTARGIELQQATQLVGRALQDPQMGLTQLRRIGVNFTKTQQDLIKGFIDTGDSISAQKIMLEELANLYGGSAEAQSRTLEGSIVGIRNAFGDLTEGMGFAIEKGLTPWLMELRTVMEGNSNILRDNTALHDKFTDAIDNTIFFIAGLVRGIKNIEMALKNTGSFIASVFMQYLSSLNVGLNLIQQGALHVAIAWNKLSGKDTRHLEDSLEQLGNKFNDLGADMLKYGEKHKKVVEENKKEIDEYDEKVATFYSNVVQNRQKMVNDLAKTKTDAGKGILPDEEVGKKVMEGTLAWYEDKLKTLKDELKTTEIGSDLFMQKLVQIAEVENILKQATDQGTEAIVKQGTAMEKFAENIEKINEDALQGFNFLDNLTDLQMAKLDKRYSKEIEQIEATTKSQHEKAQQIKALEEEHLAEQQRIGKIMKGIKIAQAISNVALGVTKALSQQDWVQAILIGLVGGTEVATIMAQEYARGGIIGGVGGTMQDNIPILASKGEAIIPADAVKKNRGQVEDLIDNKTIERNYRPFIFGQDAGNIVRTFIAEELYEASKKGWLLIDKRAIR